MNTVERRRSPRTAAFQEEAIMHVRGRDIPVTLIDISSTGALIGLMDMLALDSRKVGTDEWLELTMHYEHSIFQIGARLVRSTPQFFAVEFHDDRESIRKTLEAKVRLLASVNLPEEKAKAAAGAS